MVDYEIFGDKKVVNSLNEITTRKIGAKSELNKFERELLKEQKGLKAKREALLLCVDFREKGITNQAGRNAYVEKQQIIKEFKENIDELKNYVDSLRLDYEAACDELSNYRLLIRLEISRRGLDVVEGKL